MNIIETPFVRHEDDETCALLSNHTDKYAPVGQVVEEIWKVMKLMPEVKSRIALKLKISGTLAQWSGSGLSIRLTGVRTSYVSPRIFMNCEEFKQIAFDNGTLVSSDRLEVLYGSVLKTTGEIWECGVYRGGTAKALSGFCRTLRLFDTFCGMPEVSDKDNFHKTGDFSDVVETDVTNKLRAPHVRIYPGVIPSTFYGLEHCAIGFAHIDVDIYQSVLDCCKFIVPRLKVGGIMVFDDYGFSTCEGAKIACDEYFGELITPLSTKQAIYIKIA